MGKLGRREVERSLPEGSESKEVAFKLLKLEGGKTVPTSAEENTFDPIESFEPLKKNRAPLKPYIEALQLHQGINAPTP